MRYLEVFGFMPKYFSFTCIKVQSNFLLHKSILVTVSFLEYKTNSVYSCLLAKRGLKEIKVRAKDSELIYK